MKDMNLAGAEPADQRIWNSYVYWARSAFGEPPADLIIADPASRLPAATANLLQALVFTTFALEYRLRSVYDLLQLSVRKNDGLWALLANLERRTSGLKRKGKPIVFPPEWQQLLPRLQTLLELRNRIAHGQRGAVADLLAAEEPSLHNRAATGYNALIDAIRIINVAISYETREGDPLLQYYSRLQISHAPDPC